MDVINLNKTEDYCKLMGIKELRRFSTLSSVNIAMSELSKLTSYYPKEFNIPRRLKYSMKNNAKSFLQSNFDIHDIRYLSDKSVKKIYVDDLVETEEELLELHEKATVLISPFKLPIRYILDDPMGGQLINHFAVPKDDEMLQKIIPKIKISFNEILLSKTVTELTTTSYIHELTHALLESQKGSINDYYNVELIPIFLELLYAYETNKKLFDLIVVKRINHASICYNYMYLYNQGDESLKVGDQTYDEDQYNMDAKYVVSIIKAFNLIEYYINSSKYAKRTIITKIQNIFDGKEDLESALKDIGITFDVAFAKENIRKLVK